MTVGEYTTHASFSLVRIGESAIADVLRLYPLTC